ncbi:hypothetical protein GCM10007415_39970 [Parapedobacter pyrenivorans]|uniref:Uncharacterized protein n=2 Tax=Parapedobacter pyrenivorans TaxID=1305674 RepID=A0A917I0X5_9SPHI|nr:hypothetical protein GCM10007415_39970 [Parapedobacter pyrenivorans]
METLVSLNEKGSGAVKQLRKQRLISGLPFMINVRELAGIKCFLEYPDGSIIEVERSASGSDFETIRTLTPIEASALRDRYQLR